MAAIHPRHHHERCLTCKTSCFSGQLMNLMTRPSSFDHEQLLACGHGKLFGPGNARLPLPPMLMFDRITEISTEGGRNGKGVIRACPAAWAGTRCGNSRAFTCHGSGSPVVVVRSASAR